MANPISTVGTLTSEVSDILGIDNLDARIYEWIGLTFNDLCQRVPMHLFHATTYDVVVSGNSSVQLSEEIGTPIAMIAVNHSTSIAYIVQYRTPRDFSQLVNIGATIASSNQPLFWTIRKEATTQKLLITPPAAADIAMTMIWAGDYQASAPDGATKLSLPYHFEGVLVWGASWFGAMSIAPDRAALCQGEYELALRSMLQILGYAPDAVPVMRSISGPYGRTQFLPELPRIPDTVG